MEHTTIKVWKQTLTNLKILAAYQGSSMLSVLDRLVKEELEREEVKRKAHVQPSGAEK